MSTGVIAVVACACRLLASAELEAALRGGSGGGCSRSGDPVSCPMVADRTAVVASQLDMVLSDGDIEETEADIGPGMWCIAVDPRSARHDRG